MNLFGSDAGEMEPGDVYIVQALAGIATIGLLQERALRQGEALSEQLQGVLNSRIVIEQAKGAVAQSQGCAVDEAFELLRTYCRNNNLKLGVVAQSVLSDPASVPTLTGG